MSAHKNSGEQSTLGYRPLPNAAPSRGPDLHTMVFLVVGIALGIVAGTLIADGSFERAYTAVFHPAVQASTAVAGAARIPEARPAPNPTPDVKSPVQSAKADTSGVVSVASKAPSVQKVSVGGKAADIHEHKATMRLVSRHGRLARRHWHRRHRLHSTLKSAVKGTAPDVDARKTEIADRNFLFTVEGNATVVNYDSSAGKIETYEGETFELARTAADPGTEGWLGYPSDVQYRCDQSWNCTLFRTGGVALSARRTR